MKRRNSYLLRECIGENKEHEYLVVCGDFNGHVSKEVCGFDGVFCGLWVPKCGGEDATRVCRRMEFDSCQHLV